MKIVSVVFLLLVLCGCTVQYPIVQNPIVQYPIAGFAKDYNEVFKGTVTGRPGDAYVEGQALVSKTRCAGPARVPYIPPGSTSAQMGTGVLTCEDGRAIRAFYTTIGTITGHAYGFGVGKDQYENEYIFSFGMSDYEAAARVNEYLETASARPPLPTSKPQITQQEGVAKQKEPSKPQEKIAGFGTGFFVTNNGYLVTNNHVVESANEIVIFLSDGNALQGRIVRTDPANDLALVKVEFANRSLRIRDTGNLAIGEEVFTVGYPLPTIQGADQKATFGRVNALSGIQGDIRFIQIDVPVQPGNSGGPLVDSKGRVVGIVTARLNELAALRASGALPQNVNYAVKADYLIPLLRSFTEGNWRQTAEPVGRSTDIPSLVKIVQPSVALVIAR